MSYRKIIEISALSILMSGALSLNAAVFNMQNGDRITGSVINSADGGNVIVKTDFGTISLPKALIESAENSDGSQILGVALPAPKEEAKKEEPKAEEETAPAPVDPTAGKSQEEIDQDPQWVTDYRSFVKDYFPEHWQFRIRGGIDYRETSSKSSSYEAYFDVKREWESSVFSATAYYLFANETVNGQTGTTSDRYGINTSFRHDLNKASNWYWQNLLSYKVDFVKGIKDQIDEALTFGYRFDYSEYGLTIDIAPGPAIRYINAHGYDQKWVAMAVLSEELKWNINKILRFEQKGYLGINLTNSNQYSAYFSLGLVARITEVMDIGLRYFYEYDSINANEAQKTEQRLLLSFEFPFNWNY